MRVAFEGKTVSILDEKRPKPRKLTGTRFASIFGLNVWNTPFQAWCEITKAYNKPFEETKYTAAGKVLEPKQIKYLKDEYRMPNIVTPEDEYGDDPFKATWGDFFPEYEQFGGMWDSLVVEDDETTAIIECKSTKRAEDWQNEDGELEPPEYYALQAALYAYLKDCDGVIMPVTFLDEADYDDIEDFVVSEENTTVFTFKLSERYPNFEEEYVEPAIEWWRNHVETGISPEFDDRRDADYIKGLRTIEVSVKKDVDDLLDELYELHESIERAEAKIADKRKREKVIKDQLKKRAEEEIGDNQYAEFGNGHVKCKLTRTTKLIPDEQLMRDDGIFDDYCKEQESVRFTVNFE